MQESYCLHNDTLSSSLHLCMPFHGKSPRICKVQVSANIPLRAVRQMTIILACEPNLVQLEVAQRFSLNKVSVKGLTSSEQKEDKQNHKHH
jgi:hypothetical protein